MIGVTGATGKIGSRIALRLEKFGLKQRLIVRDPDRAPHLSKAEVARVDSYDDFTTMKTALSGVKTLFLVSAHDRMGVAQQAAQKGLPVPDYDRLQAHINVIDAAVVAGVSRVVYLSFLGEARDAVFVLSREHFHTEEYIKNTGLHFTFLRPCLYMENIPLRVSENGIIRAPAGNGKAAWVTRSDIADVAAMVLAGRGHEGKTYDVTGPEALNMAETAHKIAVASGKSVRYIELTIKETRTLHNASGMEKFEAERRALIGKGLDEDEVDIWVTHYTQIAAGALNVVSDTVSKIVGHPAQSLSEYLKLHPESYSQII